MRKILVAVDGSELGWKALETALKLAKNEGSSVSVIHVTGEQIIRAPLTAQTSSLITSETQATITAIPESIQKEETLKSLDILEKARTKAENEGIKADFIVKSGDPADQIIKEAEKTYDLLVVGFRGAHAKFPGIGSIAEKILHRAPCPILVVK
jgi:nucleotide-binding universal stress UspA family protein